MGNYPFTPGGGGGGSVNSVTAGDASIAIGGTATDPSVETGTLDQIANLHPAAANWSNNGRKITSLANGTAAQDAAAFGQIPTALPPSGSAGGDLGSTYPNPTVLATHLSSALPVNQGGTGQATQQAALDALAGAVTADEVLAGNGSHVTLRALTAADLPAAAVGLTPSGDTTGVTDAANINAAIAAVYAPDGGVVTLMPGVADWNIECGQVTASTGIYINAAGCWINARGAGDVFRFVDTSSYFGRDLRGGGILGFPVIDGTHTTGNSAAVHAGDILQLAMYCQAQNFTAGTTSKGFWFDNQNFWTEQMYGRVFAQNCTAHVVFDVSGTPAATATGSFDRSSLDIYIAQQGIANDGVVFQNGTYIIDGPGLSVNGNFNTSASLPSTAVLRLTGAAGGSRPDSGQFSRLACPLTIGTELNSASGSDGPFTIFAGASGNTIDCNGSLDFTADLPDFQASNMTAANFSFLGPVAGDATLEAIAQKPTNPLTLAQLTTMVNSGNALVASTDGTATAGGAIVLSPQSDSHGFIGIYSTTLAQYAYLVPDIANAHWAPSIGGANGQGIGVLGSTHNSGDPCFAVLNFSQAGYGVGNATFTCYDNNTVQTFRNTLDDGSGNMTVTGTIAGLTTVQGAAITGTTGTASQSITGLVSPTLATRKYSVIIDLSYLPTGTIASTTTFGFSAGGGLVLSALNLTSYIRDGSTSATISAPTSVNVTSTTLSDAMWTSPVHATPAGLSQLRIWGTVTVSTGGTLQMVFANTTSADTVNIIAGAAMTLIPV